MRIVWNYILVGGKQHAFEVQSMWMFSVCGRGSTKLVEGKEYKEPHDSWKCKTCVKKLKEKFYQNGLASSSS